ncbi:hypothetical protein AAF712_007553 [Marasmius tenuissimus]|uniref:Uncharacterized protein n=1 Tax=Marasmius tenuissimus TaxID=585030 RepID=A0ABR2ZWN9_9AGAR
MNHHEDYAFNPPPDNNQLNPVHLTTNTEVEGWRSQQNGGILGNQTTRQSTSNTTTTNTASEERATKKLRGPGGEQIETAQGRTILERDETRGRIYDPDSKISDAGEDRQTIPLPSRRVSITSQVTTGEEDAGGNNTTHKDGVKPDMTDGGEKDMEVGSTTSKASKRSWGSFTPLTSLVKPLPTDTAEWPNQDDDTEPSYQEFNPHYWTTQMGPEEPDTENFKGPAQMGPLPYVPIADDILTLNMKTNQVDQIRMSANLETKGPAYKKAMEAFQHTHERFTIRLRIPEVSNEDNQSPYSHPWFMLGQGLGQDTLKHAAHLGYITSPDDIILRIIHFEDPDNHEPWTYVNFKPNDITREEAPKVLAAIKTTAITNRSFQNFAIRNYPNYNPHASLAQRQRWILGAVSSWTLSVVETGNEKNDFYFQLMGHPLVQGRGRQKAMIDVLRKLKVVYEFFPLEEYTGVLACVWCKATTHVSAKCPLPDYPGWVGPTREELEQMGAPKTKKGGPKPKGPASKEGPSKGKPTSGEKKNLKRKF